MVYLQNVIYLLIYLQQGTLYGKICDISGKTTVDPIHDHMHYTVYIVDRPSQHATSLCLHFCYSHHLPRSNDDMVHSNMHSELAVTQYENLLQSIEYILLI